MKELRKTRQRNVALSESEDVELIRAAEIVSIERGEIIAPTTLLREEAFKSIRRILAKQEAA